MLHPSNAGRERSPSRDTLKQCGNLHVNADWPVGGLHAQSVEVKCADVSACLAQLYLRHACSGTRIATLELAYSRCYSEHFGRYPVHNEIHVSSMTVGSY